MHRIVVGALLPLLIFCNFKPVCLRKISLADCKPGLSENEFAFEGNGYAALEKEVFKPRKLSQLKFSFKTVVDEGLLYFTSTPEGQFESLELRNGKVIYKCQVNSDRVEMAAEKRYDDGLWHVLEVRWNQEQPHLVIDDSVESVARSPGRFKSPKTAVYFGGFKGQHNIEGITLKGFTGSIKDVELGGTGRRLSMYSELSNAHSGCPRRLRRQANRNSQTEFYASYIGSTNVELRWNTSSCYGDFVIEWNSELKKENETEPNEFNGTISVTNYLVEITELKPETMYAFTLKGRNNGQETPLTKTDVTTLQNYHPSLIVTSVTSSSLSVTWKVMKNFVVSLSGGDSENRTVTDGTNVTFENLSPGMSYNLHLSDLHNVTERKVVTVPEPVNVKARASDSSNQIDLTWGTTPAEVEVMYRYQWQQKEFCKVERFSGTSGRLSDLSYGCIYELDVFAVKGGRRLGSNQIVLLEIIAHEAENFTCRAGSNEGDITCNWYPRLLLHFCFVYQLNVSSSHNYHDNKYARNVSWNEVTFNSLKPPGQTFDISIQSITGNGSTTIFQTTSATAKTGIDGNFLKRSQSTNSSITIDYFKDGHRVIDYYNFTFNETLHLLNDSGQSVVLRNLNSGNCYGFTAYAVSQDVTSGTINHNICTVPNRPSSVECPKSNITNSSLVLVIQKPIDGHVEQYRITLTRGQTTNNIKPVDADESTVNELIPSLLPYIDYTVTVKSALKKPHNKESTETSIVCKTEEGIPGAVPAFFNKSSGPNSVRLGWHRPLAENGVLTDYILRVYRPDGINETIPVHPEAVEFELSDPNVYSGATFQISISAKTKVGEGLPRMLIVTLPAEQSNALFVALATLLVILFAVLIGLMVFYYIRKSPQRMMSLRQMSNRLRNQNDIAMVFPQPSVTSKPIKTSEFLECVKLLEKDSGLKFTEEYEDLKYVGRNQTREEAELQCNRVKNRFTNILPYDISRVKLLPMEDEDGSDYINANWIPGFHSKREFIATQGPLQSTTNDFWRMIWENNCQAIVMLTQCIEKGHIKCEQYWPSDMEPVFYGDLKVEILNDTKSDEWNGLDLKISLGAQSRKLKHYHYVGWPDMYVPEKKSLLAFVHVVRENTNTGSSKGPVVVHCSAGVGRTGTFIALDTLLLHIEDGHDLDVYGIVFQMRMNRVLMVQTEAQYVFIYECLCQVLEQPNGLVVKTKEAITEGENKTENSKEESNKNESESKPNSDSKEEPSKKDLEPMPNCDSKEEPSKKESESKPISDSKEEPSKKESESKPISDSKEEPSKKESESKPISDSKEEPSKKDLEQTPKSDSNEKECNKETVNNFDPEPQKENAAKEEEANK